MIAALRVAIEDNEEPFPEELTEFHAALRVSCLSILFS